MASSSVGMSAIKLKQATLAALSWRGMRALPRSDGAVAALLASVGVLIYEIAGVGRPTSFDYFGRLAESFLQGRWWLTEFPSHLSELVPCGAGRFCVAYPPMPAVLALPLVPVFGSATAQTLASAIVGGLSAAPTYLLMRAVQVPGPVAAVVTVFALTGTTLLSTASTGDAWFFAHAVAVLLASLAALGAVRGRPGWSVGALIGAATLARFPVALALPALAFIVWRVRGGSLATTGALAIAGMLPFALIQLGYNLLRWGTPTEGGYAYLSGVDNPVVPYGLFSPRYLADHLYAIFAQPPVLGDPPFVLRASPFGLSMLVLSPAFLFLIPAARKLRAHVAFAPLLAAGVIALLPDLFHGGIGARQLGYRFSLDAQPFLLPLVALGAAWNGRWHGPSRLLVAAVIWSVLATLYFTVAILSVGYA